MSRTIPELLESSEPIIMGILNVTPDSFSDGGQFTHLDDAVHQVNKMIAEGAHVIDVGGESTRPGAQPVNADEELDRVIPVIEAIRKASDIPISIDTSKAEVMKEAVQAGASMVNDVMALQGNKAVEICAELEAPVCLMHMQGQPRTMQKDPQYDNVVEEVKQFLLNRAELCVQAGVKKSNIILDPGFGFGKTLQHNLALLKNVNAFVETGFPVLIGVSRKSMFGMLLDCDVGQRLSGSLAAAVIAYNKGARIFRVHDVAETRDVLKVCQAVNNA